MNATFPRYSNQTVASTPSSNKRKRTRGAKRKKHTGLGSAWQLSSSDDRRNYARAAAPQPVTTTRHERHCALLNPKLVRACTCGGSPP
jgi:hypothetical protein